MTGLRIDHYDRSGGREAMLRFGPDGGPTVIAAMPLFEEANRTRAAIVDVLRRLAARGIAGALPDLPGMGDSLVATEEATLADWRGAFAAAARALPGPVHVMAWRGGALIDAQANVASRWRLAPVDGAGVMRDLRRAQAASDNKALFAGNALSAALIAELEGVSLLASERTRTVRLDTDPRPADAHIAGCPLWRAAEPGTDAALQTAIADDIAAWIGRMRKLIAFGCAGETLIGTLDEGESRTGLLIVSGGNEIRSGAHRGMAALAADLAGRSIPVFRFDRRGIGDSTGKNHGFRSSAPDIAAATAAFRAETGITRLVGFGNCDAASALALFGRAAGVDAVILANPWVIETADDLPPAAAIRARYADRLRDPAAWRRLLTGGVSLTKLFRGIRRIAARFEPADPLTERVLTAIDDWGDAATIVLATGDATAIAYAEVAKTAGKCTRTVAIETASHSFARSEDSIALQATIRASFRLLS